MKGPRPKFYALETKKGEENGKQILLSKTPGEIFRYMEELRPGETNRKDLDREADPETLQELEALTERNGRALSWFTVEGIRVYVSWDAYTGEDSHAGTARDLLTWERGYRSK